MQSTMDSTFDNSKIPPSFGFGQMGNTRLFDILQQDESDYTTLLTLKIRIINKLLSDLGLPLSFIGHILSTSVSVHPEIAKELIRLASKQDQIKALLAQDFNTNETIQKHLQKMCKNGQTNIVHALLAIDGLNGKLSNVPNVECKRYIENLKYGLSGQQGRYDREANDDMRRTHVNAVRKVYQVLDKYRSDDSKLVNGVYQVMRMVLKEFGGIELPEVQEKNWSENALAEGVQVYKESMSEEYFKRFVDMMKAKIASLTSTSGTDEEEGGASKKQKTK